MMQKNRIKVLHVKMKLSSDGATAIILNWARELKEEVEFDWLLSTDQGNDWAYKFEELGSKVYTLPITGKGSLNKKIKKFKRYTKFLKENHYDIIHIDTDSLRRLDVLIYALFVGVPCRIMHSHNSMSEDCGNTLKFEFIREIRKFMIGLLGTDFLACSSIAAEWLFPKRIAKKAQILKNGIYTEKFKFNENNRKKIREQLGIKDEILLGHVGRFCEQKNHRFLIDVFKNVLGKEKNYKLLLIGAGPLEDEVANQVRTYGISDNVIFLGTTDCVEKYMSAMDLFILPSTFEGLGIVNIEAQASGLYCIASDAVAKEAKVTKHMEFISLNDGPERWADKILERSQDISILCRQDMWKDVANAGYDIKSSAKKLLELYKQKIKY